MQGCLIFPPSQFAQNFHYHQFGPAAGGRTIRRAGINQPNLPPRPLHYRARLLIKICRPSPNTRHRWRLDRGPPDKSVPPEEEEEEEGKRGYEEGEKGSTGTVGGGTNVNVLAERTNQSGGQSAGLICILL